MDDALTTSVEITYIKKGEAPQSRCDTLAKEQRIAIYLNGKKLISTMSFLKDQDAHAVGFLSSEGVIESLKDISDISISDDGLKVYVNAKINEDNIKNLFHEKTLTTGCCVGVSANFEGKICEKFIATPLRVSVDKIWQMLDVFSKDTELFDSTGCVHRAMLYFLDDDTHILCEDIGRHNAIDKAIGKSILQGISTQNAILLVSGRLSMEMVIKASMADIALIISRAAPTNLGVQSAKKLGITLIGFARDNRFNIYTHASRIIK